MLRRVVLEERRYVGSLHISFMDDDAVAEGESFAGSKNQFAVFRFVFGEVTHAEDVGGKQSVSAGVPVGGVPRV